jgi:hypothetical protein
VEAEQLLAQLVGDLLEGGGELLLLGVVAGREQADVGEVLGEQLRAGERAVGLVVLGAEHAVVAGRDLQLGALGGVRVLHVGDRLARGRALVGDRAVDRAEVHRREHEVVGGRDVHRGDDGRAGGARVLGDDLVVLGLAWAAIMLPQRAVLIEVGAQDEADRDGVQQLAASKASGSCSTAAAWICDSARMWRTTLSRLLSRLLVIGVSVKVSPVM